LNGLPQTHRYEWQTIQAQKLHALSYN